MVTHIPSATLRQLLKLTKRKEALMAQIQEIDRELARLQEQSAGLPENTGHAAQVRVSRAARRPIRPQRIKRSR